MFLQKEVGFMLVRPPKESFFNQKMLKKHYILLS